MVKPSLQEVLDNVAWWQRWEIVPGVFTNGPHDVQPLIQNLDLPADLTGKRVLDIGGWNGAFSFECERRGASEVVMVEPTPSSSTGFELVRRFLESNVKLYTTSIYDLDPAWLGYFDIVLCLGIIYHLRYPLLGLDNIRRVCRGDLYVESAVLETASWSPTGIRPLDQIATGLGIYPLLQFFDQKQYFGDGTNWFVPNQKAADAMIEAAGFDIIRSHIAGRYYSVSRIKQGEAPLFRYAHEGIDYDTHGVKLLGPRAKWAHPA